MRYILLVLAWLGWSTSVQAQEPLLGCATTYDCCVKRKGAANCAPQHEGAVQRAVEDGANALRSVSPNAAEDANAVEATAIDGESVNSQLVIAAGHLALILQLSEVGGVPPGKPPNDRDTNHWWREVKTAVRNIRQELKRCQSRRQFFSAIKHARKHRPRTPEEVADIEARLVEAARKMEDAVERIPCL